jgi:hypothetical protein
MRNYYPQNIYFILLTTLAEVRLEVPGLNLSKETGSPD